MKKKKLPTWEEIHNDMDVDLIQSYINEIRHDIENFGETGWPTVEDLSNKKGCYNGDWVSDD